MNKTLKNKLFIIISLLILPLVLATPIRAHQNSHDENLNIYLFWSRTCPHCRDEKAFLEKLNQKYPNLTVNMYEITTSGENAKLFVEVGKVLNTDVSGVPFLLIGEEPIIGYLNDETTGVSIENKIMEALNNPPRDLVHEILDTSSVSPKPTQLKPPDLDPPTNADTLIEIPLIGIINTADLSLPVLTFVIALLDGFNPCAMWVLLFLIGILLGMENRTKMWVLGGTFILASGFVYFLFLSAWLNFFLFIGYSTTVRYIIGTVALGTGAYYLRDYYKNKDGGCEVMEDEKRQKVFERIRNVVRKENFLLALIGIILLAFAVNVVELLCSAGLPAVYTKTLTMSQLPTLKYYSYLIFYIVIFMLDDLLVFTIAMVTMRAFGVQNKYARYSHLIGGILITGIGILMIFRPEILMFG